MTKEDVFKMSMLTKTFIGINSNHELCLKCYYALNQIEKFRIQIRKNPCLVPTRCNKNVSLLNALGAMGIKEELLEGSEKPQATNIFQKTKQKFCDIEDMCDRCVIALRLSDEFRLQIKHNSWLQTATSDEKAKWIDQKITNVLTPSCSHQHSDGGDDEDSIDVVN